MFFDPSPILTDLGIPEPSEVADAYKMAGTVQALANLSPAEVLPHTTSAATVEDDMRRYLIERELRTYAQEMNRHFQRHAHDLTRDIYRRTAPDLIPEVSKRAEKPLKVITDAAKHLHPDDTAETAIERGKAATDAWRKRDQLEEARGLLSRAAQVQRMLGELVRTIPANTPEHDLLWWVDAEDHNHLARLVHETDANGPGGRFLALAHAGHSLALATPEQFMSRVQHIAETAEDESTRGQRAARARIEARNREIGERLVAAHERTMVRD